MAKRGRPSDYSPEIAETNGPQARAVLPCYSDAEKCFDGIHPLRQYRYEMDEKLAIKCGLPLEDLREYMVSGDPKVDPEVEPKVPLGRPGSQAR